MDARLLHYYHQELRYLREMGSEFAGQFPKIASRLGMEGLEVADPYVERLLEGSAFLAARVQLKLDAEFPRLSHRLLDMVYPGLMAPQPAMLVARIDPTPDANLLQGPVLPRGSLLLAAAGSASATRCEFRTTQPCVLTPVSTASAEWLPDIGDLGVSELALAGPVRSALRIGLQLPAGMGFSQLRIDSLRFYLAGPADVAMRLHELLLTAVLGVMAGGRWWPAAEILPVGYAPEDAMLPSTPNALSGARLLQEYFGFAERFLFVDVTGLGPAFAATTGDRLDLVLLLSPANPGLRGTVGVENFSLHCVPAVNLFAKRAERIHIHEGEHEFHVVPDRSLPLDFEVYDLLSMTGYDDAGERRFTPLYGAAGQGDAHYTVRREPRVASETVVRDGPRSGYVGSEVFVSLVDPQEAPFSGTLRQVAVQTRCTNRDLPMFLPVGGEFSLDTGLPLRSARLVAGPSRPFSALREGRMAWRLLNLLSLNYLSLLDSGTGSAVAALRDLLGRLPQAGEPAVRRQIEALQQVDAQAVVRRHPAPGPIAFGRGIQVRLRVDELGHAGGSAFLFGAALHHYLAQHASMNSFVETVLESLSRGEVARWKPAGGRRPVL